MRYEKDRTHLKPNQKYKNESRKTRRRRTVRKKDRKPQKLPTYISAEALITTKPKNECTLHQKKVRKNQTEHDFRKLNREEVTVTASLFTGAVRSSYVLRFVHKNFIVAARNLIPGQRIRIDEGRFELRAGRKQSEFLVKSFAVISDYELQIPMTSHLKREINVHTETEIKQDQENVREESAADKKALNFANSPDAF